MPKVSVLIAVFNGARTIAKSIQSAQVQTLHDIEILVVDDASTDTTSAMVESMAQQDARIRLLRQTVNAGPGAARNTGIQAATGEWIAILDADDWMEPNRLEVMISEAERTGVDVVGDNMEIFDHALGCVIDKTSFYGNSKPALMKLEDLFRLDNPLRRHSLGYMQPIIKRSFLMSHNLYYRIEYRVGEDFLLLAEILLKGGKVLIVPGAYYVYRHTFSPTTRKKSHESHTDDRFDLIICGCDELMARYGQVMTTTASHELARRRKIFETRISLKNMLRKLRQKRVGNALLILLRHPSILRQMGSAVFKMIYANLLSFLHREDGVHTYVSTNAHIVANGTPKVSVIIAVLNGITTIGHAIESARYQSERYIEIIVVDDGSTDGTPDLVDEIAQKDPRVRCIRLERNMGPAAATNIGIREAKADWIAILDADDWFEPQRLEKMLQEAHTGNVDAVYDNLKIFDHELKRITYNTRFGKKREASLLTVERFFQQDTPLHRTAIGYLKPLMRKQFLADHQIAYDEANRVGYDFTMMSEILLSGGRVAIIPGAYYNYVHMFSPTTRKKSPTSHTKNNYSGIIQSCDHLLNKYSRKMSPEARHALIRRRYMFESRLKCNDMVEAFENGQIMKAAGVIVQWPFIPAILVAAAMKMFYANIQNIFWNLKSRRTA